MKYRCMIVVSMMIDIKDIMSDIPPYALAFLLLNFKAVLLLQQSCLSNITTSKRDISMIEVSMMLDIKGHHL